MRFHFKIQEVAFHIREVAFHIHKVVFLIGGDDDK